MGMKRMLTAAAVGVASLLCAAPLKMEWKAISEAPEAVARPYVYSLGCGSHSFVGGVGVYIQRGFYAFVSYRAGERFDIHSVPQSLRCEGVAECVERHLLTACVFKDLRELLSARTWIAWQVLFSFIRRWEQPL